MTTENKTQGPDHLPPISEDSSELTQTMLQTGVLFPPSHPGVLGNMDRFEVKRLLDSGGMGQVLLAREPVTGAQVAIKVVRPEYIGNTPFTNRFLTEARHMYGMSHPNILKFI